MKKPITPNHRIINLKKLKNLLMVFCLFIFSATANPAQAQTPCILGGYASVFDICPSTPYQLQGGCADPGAFSSCPSSIYAIGWERNGVGVSTGSYNYLATQTGSYRFRITYQVFTGLFCGNIDYYTYTSPTKYLEFTTPTQIFSVSSSAPLPICPGSTTSLSVNGNLGGNSNANWYWYAGGCGAAPVGIGSAIQVSPASTTTYYVRSQSHCGLGNCASITVTVTSPLAAPTAATANPISILPGGSSTLTVHGVAGGFHTIAWYDDAALSNLVATGQDAVVSPTSTTTYYVRYESGPPCNLNTASQSVTVTVTCPVQMNCRDISVTLDANGQANIITDVNTSQLPAFTKSVISVCPATPVSGPTCDCPDGYVVTGYSADLGNGWGPNVISRYKLHCTELLPNGTLGTNTTITCENGSATGSSAGSDNAPAGEVVVGTQIRIGCAIDRITGFSKPIADIITSTANNSSTMMTGVGGTGGGLQPAQYAPDGHVIVGMQTYTDNFIAAGVAWRYAPISEIMNIGGTAASECGAVTSTFSPTSFDCTNIGANTVIYTVTNSLGEVSTCTFTVNVIDDEPPVITCPGNITVNNDPGVCGAMVTYSVMSSDNCTGETVIQTAGLASGSLFPVGTTTNTFEVTDVAGNVATCSFDVTVNDNEPPVVTCTSGTQNTSDDGTGDCTFTSSLFGQGGSYSISDNCAGPYTIVEQFTGALNATATWSLNQGGTPVRTFPVGVTNVFITVTDQSGNTSSCSYTTTIIDDEAPTITCAGNVTVNTDPGVCGASYTAQPPAATDNCSVTVTALGPNLTSNGSFTQNHIGWNDCNNSVEAYGQETSYGGSNPGNIVAEIDHEPQSLCQNLNNMVVGETYILSFKASRRNIAPSTVGADITIDGGALNATVTRSNLSFDLTAESFTFVATQTSHQLTFTASAGWSGTLGLIVDDIFINQYLTAPYNANIPVGTSVITWIATDGSGNTASCTQNIIVVDNEAPTIDCPADVEFCFGDPVVIGNATSTDNCGTTNIINDAPVGFAPGITIVTWTSTDAAGNFSTCTHTVTVHLLNATTTVVDVLCYGENTGSITINTVTIPLANPVDIIYSLDGGVTTQSSDLFDNLYAGNYSVTMINTATNCTTSVNAVISEPASAVTVSVSSSTPSCYGVSTGTATASGSGGTPGYTYEWFDNLNTKVSVNDFAGSLSPGTYTVVVTDANGCTSTATTTISELPEVIVDLGMDKTIFYGALGFNGCHTLTPTVVNGTAPLTYSWSSSNPDPAIVASSDPSLNVCVTTDVIHSYTVLVTDANGCTGSATVNIIYANIDCSNQQNSTKVTICNVPAGNPSNCKTICVSVNAAAALLANGGYVGPCLPDCYLPEARTYNSAPLLNDSELHLYPNPTSTVINVEFKSDTNDAEAIVIVDLQGRVIEKINIHGVFEYTGTFDFTTYENGIYFVKIMSNNSVLKTAKVVKAE